MNIQDFNKEVKNFNNSADRVIYHFNHLQMLNAFSLNHKKEKIISVEYGKSKQKIIIYYQYTRY